MPTDGITHGGYKLVYSDKIPSWLSAITDAEHAKQPIELQFRRGEEYKSFSIPYYGGLRIPSLERVDGTPDRLDEILAPSKRAMPAM